MSKNGIKFSGKTKVQQSFKESTKISNIVSKAMQGQQPANAGQPMYMDSYNVPSFHEAQNLVTEVIQKFMNLPAPLRARFGNKPQNAIKFCQDDNNLDEAIKLGLARKPEEIKEEIPVKVEVTNPSTPKEKTP